MIAKSKTQVKFAIPRPKKRLGQHFLVNKGILDKIINEAELSPNDVVLEIGAGAGTLTKALAARVKKVIAVEKDNRLIQLLAENLSDFKNIKIVQADIREILNSKFKIQNTYKVVGNIPYYLTSRLIRLLLELPQPPKLMVLMLQKEVAQRIVANPPKMSLLAASVQFYAEPKIVAYVSQNSFWPKPKVDSAILKLKIKNSRFKAQNFFGLLKAGFSRPRKKLINNLAIKLLVDKNTILAWFKSCKIEGSARAENLSMTQWLCLAKEF